MIRKAVIGLPLLVLLLGAAPQAPKVSAHEKAARELFHALGGEDLAAQNAGALVATLFSDPEMAPFESVFRDWYRQAIARGDLESEMVKLYMDIFSEKELAEILAFYRTPAGRKAIEAAPQLMAKGAELGMRYAREHPEELQDVLTKAMEEHAKQPPATDKEAQKRTIADIRNTGTAMFAWLTDQVGAAAAGDTQTEQPVSTVELKHYPIVTREQLRKVLVPSYIQDVPETDGWGNPYEFYLNTANPMAPQVMGIRSPGRDGRFSAASYTVGPFDPDDFDEDIVWADGFFVRWPQKQE